MAAFIRRIGGEGLYSSKTWTIVTDPANRDATSPVFDVPFEESHDSRSWVADFHHTLEPFRSMRAVSSRAGRTSILGTGADKCIENSDRSIPGISRVEARQAVIAMKLMSLQDAALCPKSGPICGEFETTDKVVLGNRQPDKDAARADRANAWDSPE